MKPAAIAAALMALAITSVPTAHAQLAESGLQARVAGHVADRPERLLCRGLPDAEVFTRTELFFGLSRPGGVVSERDFKAFVDAYVTPRFPDGLTLLSGVGQFRDASGTTIVEGSKLLILLSRDATARPTARSSRSAPTTSARSSSSRCCAATTRRAFRSS